MSNEEPARPGTARLRRGVIAVAGGAACIVSLMTLPGGLPLAEMGAALLGVALLVAGTVWVGTSTEHRPA